eukprot:7382559-Alexandrium_andersonii.AAC.1
MSASLVGSEMCIRDSAEAPQSRSQSSGALQSRTGAWIQAGASRCLRFCACLLYTSDAADDM